MEEALSELEEAVRGGNMVLDDFHDDGHEHDDGGVFSGAAAEGDGVADGESDDEDFLPKSLASFVAEAEATLEHTQLSFQDGSDAESDSFHLDPPEIKEPENAGGETDKEVAPADSAAKEVGGGGGEGENGDDDGFENFRRDELDFVERDNSYQRPYMGSPKSRALRRALDDLRSPLSDNSDGSMSLCSPSSAANLNPAANLTPATAKYLAIGTPAPPHVQPVIAEEDAEGNDDSLHLYGPDVENLTSMMQSHSLAEHADHPEILVASENLSQSPPETNGDRPKKHVVSFSNNVVSTAPSSPPYRTPKSTGGSHPGFKAMFSLHGNASPGDGSKKQRIFPAKEASTPSPTSTSTIGKTTPRNGSAQKIGGRYSSSPLHRETSRRATASPANLKDRKSVATISSTRVVQTKPGRTTVSNSMSVVQPAHPRNHKAKSTEDKKAFFDRLSQPSKRNSVAPEPKLGSTAAKTRNAGSTKAARGTIHKPKHLKEASRPSRHDGEDAESSSARHADIASHTTEHVFNLRVDDQSGREGNINFISNSDEANAGSLAARPESTSDSVDGFDDAFLPNQELNGAQLGSRDSSQFGDTSNFHGTPEGSGRTRVSHVWYMEQPGAGAGGVAPGHGRVSRQSNGTSGIEDSRKNGGPPLSSLAGMEKSSSRNGVMRMAGTPADVESSRRKSAVHGDGGAAKARERVRLRQKAEMEKRKSQQGSAATNAPVKNDDSRTSARERIRERQRRAEAKRLELKKKASLGEPTRFPGDKESSGGRDKREPNSVDPSTNSRRSSAGRPRVTVPKGPRLSTTAKYGEKHAPLQRQGTGTIQPPSKPSTKPHVTTPVPFQFHGTTSTTAVAPKEPKRGIVEEMDHFMKRGLRKNGPELSIPREKRLTVPVSPKFAPRPKRDRPQSTAEREMEEMEFFNSNPFRAAPIMHASSGTPGSHSGVPKVQKRTLTTPNPPRLRTVERRHSKQPIVLDGKAKEDEEELKKQFLARPLPDLSYRGASPSTRTPAKLTTPEPFKLSSDTRVPRPHQQEDDMELVKQFKARPLPRFTHQSPADVSASRTPTVPREIRLSTSNRREKRGASISASRLHIQTMEQERAERKQREVRMKHEAELALASHSPPAAPTQPQPFQFHTAARHETSQQRMEEEQLRREEGEKRARNFYARPIITAPSSSSILTSPPRPTTEPHPFQLRTESRHERAQRELEEKLEMEESERLRLMNRKARQVPQSMYKFTPISPKPSPKVIPTYTPPMNSAQRVILRNKYDLRVGKARAEKLAMQKAWEEQKQAEEEAELQRLRRLPVSEGGLIPKATPVKRG